MRPKLFERLFPKQISLLKIAALKLRREKESRQIKAANRRFEWGGPRSLVRSGTSGGKETPNPNPEEMEKYWKGLLEVEGEYGPSDRAVSEWETAARSGVYSEESLNREEAWKQVRSKVSNWKAPGRDGIYGAWLKAFPSLETALVDQLWSMINLETRVPDWLVEGRTVLIPKEGCTGRPEQYRPITCLNVTYKALTGLLSEIIRHHLGDSDVFPEEQKALRRGRRGCLDALALDAALSEEARAERRDLSVSWIDFSKAYDRVPHKWITRMLKAIRMPRSARKCISRLIPLWRTNIEMRRGKEVQSAFVHLKRGLFQGDSLSPLLFCLVIAPVSWALRKGLGFNSRYHQQPLTHQFFMDDLKIYADSKRALRRASRRAERSARAVGMKLGLRKCATCHIEKGRIVEGGDLHLAEGTITEVEYGSTYKYLGVDQLAGADRKKTKDRVTAEYRKRLWKVSREKVVQI